MAECSGRSLLEELERIRGSIPMQTQRERETERTERETKRAKGLRKSEHRVSKD